MLFVLFVFSISCIEDDFTTSSNDKLTFSTDTIAFDTIFTELATPTAKFMVYNKNKKMIKISSIKMNGASKAKFFLNVDGIKGDEFKDVEIRGKDSIFVYVQAHIDINNDNNPLKIEDKIEFLTNGNLQEIVINAWGQDVTRLRNQKYTEDAVLTADKPYIIFDTLYVAKNATLTIEPGTRLYFHDKAAMQIDGTLKATGSKDKFIHLRGDRIDKVVADIDFDIMSGQWNGIHFGENSYNNEIQYMYMRGSTNGITLDSCNIEQPKLHIFNSILHNASNNVLTGSYCNISAEGTEFSDCKNSVVALAGGKHRFINCTFANYYLFSAIFSSIINLDYAIPEQQQDLPLMDAKFDNCIIYGNSADINIGDLAGSKVYFRNSLFKSKGSNDNNFIDCVWGEDPLFYTIREEYIFDFRLKNESPAINTGNTEYCPEHARTDLLGIPRIREDGGIDIGAYTWVEAKEEENQ